MKNTLFRLTSSDCINAQIQREEIDKIIQVQKKKQEDKKSSLLHQFAALQKHNKEDSSRHRVSAFSIRRTRKKELPKKLENCSPFKSQSLGLGEQINYFSVKKRYERIIDSSFDEQLNSQLRCELLFPRTDRLCRQESTNSNFFHKVFSKQSKLRKYFQQVQMVRKQRMSISQEMGVR